MTNHGAKMWTCPSCGWVNDPRTQWDNHNRSMCGGCRRMRGAPATNVAEVIDKCPDAIVDMMSPVTAARGGVRTWADGRPWG